MTHELEYQSGEDAPDLSYEYRERNAVLKRDWAAVHTIADKREPLPFFGRKLRTWRR